MRMTPSEAFVETMASNGVTDMFGIMGSAFMDAMDIFAPAGIRLIPVVHEQGAAHMADGSFKANAVPSISNFLGDQGVLLFTNTGCEHVPAVPVDGVIDIVGAGDSFMAAVMSAVCCTPSARATASSYSMKVAGFSCGSARRWRAGGSRSFR